MANNTPAFVLAAGMGVITGMRSMSPLALLSRRLAQRPRPRRHHPVTDFLAAPGIARSLGVLAAGEMVADKTPFVPDRTAPSALAGRAGMAALCGVAVAEWRGGSRWGAALVSAAAAVGSTFFAYHVRQWAAQRSGLPDPVLGLVEDAAVVGLGMRLTSAEASSK